MTLRAKGRAAGVAAAENHSDPEMIASAVSDVWEPVVQAFMSTPDARYHGRPFYGAQYGCPACAMGRNCSFANAVRMAREEYAE